MAQPHSIIHGLPVMSWNNLDAPPYDVASLNWSHDHGQRSYPYVDGVSHRWTGMGEMAMQFRFYFLNTVQRRAFPHLWEEWQPELMDGSTGTLLHPLLGEVDAVVRSASVALEAIATAGVIVDVQFALDLPDPEEALKFGTLSINITEVASLATGAASAAPKPPSQKSVLDLLDLIKQIEGLKYQFELEILGIINKAKSICDEIIGFFDGFDDHEFLYPKDLMQQLWGHLDDLGNAAALEKARKISEVVVTNDTTLTEFARERGNTVADIAGLNPQALVSPTVPRGSKLKFYP